MTPHLIRRGALTLAVALASGGLAVTLAPAAHAAGPALKATFTQTSVWVSGYGAKFTVTNTGDAASASWKVDFDLQPGTTITNSWNATLTSSAGHYSFSNLSSNGKIAPGGSVSVGFNAANLGEPLNCVIGGVPCGGTATTPPTTTPVVPTPTVPVKPPTAGQIIDVGTAAQLSAALTAVRPGQTIRLAPGTYNGAFLTQVAGTASAPITLTGPASAVITNPTKAGDPPGDCSVPAAGFNPGYGLWLYKAPYWQLTGFTLNTAAKGIIMDNSAHVLIDGVTVKNIGDEAVHFRSTSPDGVIQNSTITDTGKAQPDYGEGVYLGSANSNWKCYGNTGGVDASNNVKVLHNRIGPNVAAEHVDIKEGTTGGIISGNTFNGQGILGQNSADSWIDVKGNDYLLEFNTGSFTKPGVFANGYETHQQVAGYGCGNTWRNNTSDLGGVGLFAINSTNQSKCATRNVVYASNTVTNPAAGGGVTNIAITP